MRRFDKKTNIANANIIAEQRHLESKGVISEGSYTGVSDLIVNIDYDNDATMIADKHYHHGPDNSTEFEIDKIQSDFDPDDTLSVVGDILSKHKFNKILLKVTHDGEELEDTFDMGNWKGIGYYIKAQR
jgi:hypothetical protein